MLTSMFPRVRAMLLVASLLLGSSGAASAEGADHAAVVLSLHFDAPTDRTVAAFGPVSEASWSPGFTPQFIYPRAPKQVAGAVFRTSDGRVWLLHDYDVAAGLVQYVISDANAEITLTIRVLPAGTGSSATMTYDVVALNAAGAEHIAMLRDHSRELSTHMQAAIDAYLAK
jgi:hypothetical protein